MQREDAQRGTERQGEGQGKCTVEHLVTPAGPLDNLAEATLGLFTQHDSACRHLVHQLVERLLGVHATFCGESRGQ